MANEDNVILQELRALRGEVRRLEETLRGPTSTRGGAPFLPALTNDNLLSVSVERAGRRDRFPFVFTFTGLLDVQLRASSIRAAVLLAALLDLTERMDGGKALADRQSVAAEIHAALEPTGYRPSKRLENVRVALSRLEFWLQDHRPQSSEHSTFHLAISSPSFDLSLTDGTGAPPTRPFRVEIESSDRVIATLCTKFLSTSPLSRARKRPVIFIPGGPSGFDRLFLELFSHPKKVVERSMFFKPSIITYPLSLLEFMGTSSEDIERRRIALSRLKDSRAEFTEILSRRSLAMLIDYETTTAKFKLYAPNVTQRHVEDHLMSLTAMALDLPGYNLCLTDAPLPFLVSTFLLDGDERPETFTIFFKQEMSEHDPDMSCVVITDPALYDAISEHVFEWVLGHPTTLRKREDVARELGFYLARLRSTSSAVTS